MITRNKKRFFAFSVLFGLLAGCQSVDSLRFKQMKDTAIDTSNVLIFCEGTPDCEFERINQTRIIHPENGRVFKEAMQQKMVRLKEKSLRQPNSVYLSVPAGQHELVVRFYPISKQKAETLHIFHRFQSAQRYSLKMYREPTTKTTSLLNASAPAPLCVDLIQDKKTLRRFCKPYNVQTGIGEFVEQKI